MAYHSLSLRSLHLALVSIAVVSLAAEEARVVATARAEHFVVALVSLLEDVVTHWHWTVPEPGFVHDQKVVLEPCEKILKFSLREQAQDVIQCDAIQAVRTLEVAARRLRF